MGLRLGFGFGLGLGVSIRVGVRGCAATQSCCGSSNISSLWWLTVTMVALTWLVVSTEY